MRFFSEHDESRQDPKGNSMSQSDLPTSVLPERLIQFMQLSLGWCSAESQASAQTIMQAIEALLKKTERVASISSESLSVLATLQGTLSRHFAEQEEIKPVKNLVDSLGALSREHKEVGGMIEPIIEALQYQDRLRQNLENMTKLMRLWMDLRTKAPVEFCTNVSVGEKMLACMTTVDERNIIRKYIPELPPEESIEGQVAMF